MKNSNWPAGSKIIRQLRMYHYLICHADGFRGPKELMDFLAADMRMVQRDLKDIRDAGLLKLKYDKATDNYVDDGEAAFNSEAEGQRQKHLTRLNRLCRLMFELEFPDLEEVFDYQAAMHDYQEMKKASKASPEAYPLEEMEELDEPPIAPDFPDVAKQYSQLFPDCTLRTRQRDFETLTNAGMKIVYSRKYKTYLMEDQVEEEGYYLMYIL